MGNQFPYDHGTAQSGLLLINPVGVEKVGFPEKSRKSGDRKCLGGWGKSFVELPDSKQFLRILDERVFQQPLLLSRNIKGAHFAVGFDRSHHHLPKGAPL
jgi:hypothetical protein